MNDKHTGPDEDQPTVIERGGLRAWIEAQLGDDSEWWAQFAADTADRVRTARACNDRGEPWPAWSGREAAAVALVLDDADRLADAGLDSTEAALRYVADGGLDDPEDMAAYIADIRARADLEG